MSSALLLNLNPLAIIALFTALIAYTVTIVFFLYSKKTVHRLWSFFNFAVGSWALFTFFAASSKNPLLAQEFWKISHKPGYFIAIIFAHFVCEYCSYKSYKLITFGYFYAIAANLATLLINPEIFYYPNPAYLYNSIYYLQVKSLNWILLLIPWAFFLGWSLIKLHRYCQNIQAPKNADALFILFILVIGFSGGLSTFFPMCGYTNFYPYTLVLTLFYEFGASYLIFKREVFEIDFVIQKSVLYSTLISFLTLFYLILIFLTDQFLINNWEFYNFLTRFFALIVIALAFNPLRNRLQNIIDQTLFKATPVQLAEQNELLRQNAVQAEKMRVVATLASSIAHEIKNPLTALKTFVEYFPEKKNDPTFQEKFQKIASSEINRIEKIISELLEFAKPSPLTLKDTDIRKVLDHALNLTENQLKKNDITIKTDFAENLPSIKGDANKLLQVFINLILNAKDAMPTGGVLTVFTESADHPLSKSSIPNPKSVTISFTDTGCGIPKENLKQVFEPFFSTKEKGTGLGLAIVKGIIDEHGGKIGVASEIGNGTRFEIVFPTERLKS